MRNIAVPILLLAQALAAFGQSVVDTGSINIATSRSTNVPPDQIVLTLQVMSGFKTDLNDILKAVQPVGVTVDSFVDVNGDDQALFWQFSLPVTVPKVAATIAMLTTLEKALSQSGLVLTVWSGGSQVSAEVQASQKCATPELIADAQAQAQQLATAAGVVVGPIIAVSDGTVGFGFGVTTGFGSPGGPGPTIPIIGSVYSNRPRSPLLTIPRSAAPRGCSAVVKFRLYR